MEFVYLSVCLFMPVSLSLSFSLSPSLSQDGGRTVYTEFCSAIFVIFSSQK